MTPRARTAVTGRGEPRPLLTVLALSWGFVELRANADLEPASRTPGFVDFPKAAVAAGASTCRFFEP